MKTKIWNIPTGNSDIRALRGLFASKHARQVLLILFATLVPSLTTSARAQVTYTYTGTPFTYLWNIGTGPGVTNISGYFEVASALAPNETFLLTPSAFLNYSFTDGRYTVNLANYAISNSLGYGAVGYSYPTFAVSTGASGQLTSWDLNILSSSAYINTSNVVPSSLWSSDPVYATLWDEGDPLDVVVANPSQAYNAYNNNSAGSWSVSGIPEPSTYAALFGLAALGFAACRRRQRQQG